MNSELHRPSLIPIQPTQRFAPEAQFFHNNPNKRPTQVLMRPSMMMPNQNPNYAETNSPYQRPPLNLNPNPSQFPRTSRRDGTGNLYMFDDSGSNSPANRNPVMRSFESSKDMYSPSPKKSTLLQTGNSVLSPYNYSGNTLAPPSQDNYGFNNHQGFNPNKSPTLSPNTNQNFLSGGGFTQGMSPSFSQNNNNNNNNMGPAQNPNLGPGFSQNFNHRPSHFSNRSVGNSNALVHKGFANLALMNMPPIMSDGRNSMPMVNSMPNRRGTMIQPGPGGNEQNMKDFERLVDSHTQNLEKLVKNMDSREQTIPRMNNRLAYSKSTRNTLVELAGSEMPISYDQRFLQKSASTRLMPPPNQYQNYQRAEPDSRHQEQNSEEEESEEESRDVVIQPSHFSKASSLPPPEQLRNPQKRNTFLKLNARLNPTEVKKRKRATVDIKRIMWVMAYPILFKASILKKAEDSKTKGLKGMLKRTQEATNFVVEYIKQHCGNSLKNLCKDGKALVMVNNDEPDLKKHLSEKDLKKNAVFTVGKLIAVFEELIASLTKTNLDDDFVSLFADLTSNHAYLPQKYFTEFELSCLEFNTYGGLKNMSPIRVKMMIANAVLVKGLIYAFLTQPWAVLPNVKETPILARGLKSCASALYHVIMDIYKDNILIDKENQKNLHADRKVKFVKPSSVFVPEGTTPKVSKDEASSEILCGLWTRDNLNSCWKHAKSEVEKLRELVMECFEKFYDPVEKAQEEKKMLAGKSK